MIDDNNALALMCQETPKPMQVVIVKQKAGSAQVNGTGNVTSNPNILSTQAGPSIGWNGDDGLERTTPPPLVTSAREPKQNEWKPNDSDDFKSNFSTSTSSSHQKTGDYQSSPNGENQNDMMIDSQDDYFPMMDDDEAADDVDSPLIFSHESTQAPSSRMMPHIPHDGVSILGDDNSSSHRSSGTHVSRLSNGSVVATYSVTSTYSHRLLKARKSKFLCSLQNLEKLPKVTETSAQKKLNHRGREKKKKRPSKKPSRRKTKSSRTSIGKRIGRGAVSTSSVRSHNQGIHLISSLIE